MTTEDEPGQPPTATPLDTLCARLESLTLHELLALRDATLAIPRGDLDRAHTAALAAAWKADRLHAFFSAGERAAFAVARSIAGAVVDLTASRLAARPGEPAPVLDECKQEADDLVQIGMEAAIHAAHSYVVGDLVAVEILRRPFEQALA